ncbi:hypothetical protein TWF694_004684 [Orbilia ellipsospora]|uniref:G domain-containing protein n=1 Tax=Orbilia ellipsospora TaxID=2528407 RepID=A0AAV9WYF5_9PEZI
MDGSDDRVNILVIGPSQNGKSTFINKIRELSLPTSQERAEEGNLGSSCTTFCTAYDFQFPRTRYRLFDHREEGYVHVAEEDEETYFSKMWRKKTSEFCEIHPIDNHPRYFNLRIIDTPGLDDSQGSGQDDCNIAEVMGYLHKMAMNDELPKYITALVLILSIETPFSEHLQKIFKYYERCMPNLFGGLAIVNTNFTAEVWKSRFDDRRKKSRMEKVAKAFATDTSKVDTMRERRQDFASIFNRDARHFFIDSVPDSRRIVEQLTSHNQMYDIITYLACQSQMPVTNVKLYKSPRMAQIDGLLVNWLNDARGDLTREETKLTAHLGEAHAVRAENAKKLQSFRTEIEQLEKELTIYNNDNDYTLKTHSTGGQDRASTPGLMGRYIIRTKIKNTKIITEPDYPGFKVETYNDEPYARWGKQMFIDNQNQRQWVGQYEGSPGHLPVLTAKTLVSNKQFYANQIRKLKEDITRRSADLNSEENLERYFKSQNAIDSKMLDPTLKRIALGLSEINDLVNSLNADWLPIEVGLNDAARKRYTKVDMKKVTPQDLVEMVEGKGYHELAEELREMDRKNRFETMGV